MAEYAFGSGSLFGVRTDNAGPNTPVTFGALQDVSIDFSFTNKELRGRFQYPLTVARGGGKIACKAKAAQINGRIWNDLFFAATMAAGQVITIMDEAGAVPASSTYTIVAAHVTGIVDLGVKYAATGLPLTKVASVAAIGQYSFDGTTGTYTFYSGDASVAMLLNYTYIAANTGQKITITNQLMGSAPYFSATLTEAYDGKKLTVVLNKCVASKLTMATKLEDFMIPEFDFEAMADAAGNVGTISVDELG